MKKERTVIHVYIKNSDSHYYFGSIANIFEHFSRNEVGIGYASLRNFGLSANKPYENARCVIRKGLLLSKPSNRGKKE